MNDSNYATEDMFKDPKELEHIMAQWENDMPSKSQSPPDPITVH